jgi:hypothetical protein
VNACRSAHSDFAFDHGHHDGAAVFEPDLPADVFILPASETRATDPIVVPDTLFPPFADIVTILAVGTDSGIFPILQSDGRG